MESASIVDELELLNQRVAHGLFNMSNAMSTPPISSSPRIIFPAKGGEVRVSEQEARAIYINTLEQSNYYYSIETPTNESYSFSGQYPRKAQSDLSIYSMSGGRLVKAANVELKAHNPKIENIRKDVEKLITEECPGNWFHVFKNADRNTIPALLKKLERSFNECAPLLINHAVRSQHIVIYFTICVIETKRSYLRLYDFVIPAYDDRSAVARAYELYNRIFFNATTWDG